MQLLILLSLVLLVACAAPPAARLTPVECSGTYRIEASNAHVRYLTKELLFEGGELIVGTKTCAIVDVTINHGILDSTIFVEMGEVE